MFLLTFCTVIILIKIYFSVIMKSHYENSKIETTYFIFLDCFAKLKNLLEMMINKNIFFVI